MRPHRPNKRGISPILATIILVGFAVALGSVVMTWSSMFIYKTGLNETASSSVTTTPCTEPIDLLNIRLAKGEIGQETYNSLKTQISSPP